MPASLESAGRRVSVGGCRAVRRAVFTILLAVAATTASRGGPVGLQGDRVSFDAPRDYYVESYSVAIADVNKDGSPDVIAGTKNISVLFGRPDGVLQEPVQLAAGTDPVVRIAVGDFNGDTNPDFASAVWVDPGIVSVRLGLGNGTFTPPTDYTLASRPSDLVVADFNGDRILDLATANPHLSAGSLLLGVGDGTFQPASSLPLGGVPTGLVPADFNADSHEDLAVSDYPGDVGGRALRIFLGDGRGGFQLTSTLDVDPALAENHRVGPPRDYDGNGTVDLLVLMVCPCGGLEGVHLFRGAGDGTFPMHSRVFAEFVDDIVVADFDGDLKVDIAAMQSYGATVTVLSGNDDGTFALTSRNEMSWGGGGNETSLHMSDFNQDGKADLAVANHNIALLQVRRGKGDGTFEAARIVAYPASIGWMVSADFNGDRHADIALSTSTSPTSLSVWLGNGDGTFQPGIDVAEPRVTHFGAAADLNGDSVPDMISLNAAREGDRPDDVFVYLGHGDGSFEPAMSFTSGEAPASLAVADFNGDAVPDVAVANRGAFGTFPTRSTVVVLPGLGNGRFGNAVQLAPAREAAVVVAADFNGDLRPDLAVSQRSSVSEYPGAIGIYLNQGNGSFSASYLPTPAPWVPSTLSTADLNGDARADLLLTIHNGNEYFSRRSVLVTLLGNGDGTFALGGTSIVGGRIVNPLAVDVVDLDGNLVLDVAVGGLSAMHVFTSNGDGTLAPAGNFSVEGEFVHGSAAADYNDDAKPDILVLSQISRRDGGQVVGTRILRLLTNTSPVRQQSLLSHVK